VEKLKEHDITLRAGDIILRPMTEDDWGTLKKWNSDPEVTHFAGGIGGNTLEQVKRVYRSISQNAFCFIIEFKEKPIGECYLQKMNLERILEKLPDQDLRRIDIMIGEKEFWGQGIGTEVVGMLLRYGFEMEDADAIFGCDVDDYNKRSLKMFQKLGFEVFSTMGESTGRGKLSYDLVLPREKYRE